MQAVLDLFFRVVHNLCKLLLAVQVAACATVFVGRYIVGKTPTWADPVAMLCMVWLCILSSALAVRSDEHLRLTVIDGFVSRRTLGALNLLSAVIVLGIAVFLVHAGWQLTLLSARNKIAGLGIPTSYVAAVIPLTGVCYLMALLDRFLNVWRNHNER